MKKITITGMSSCEKKELEILDREKIEEILNDLLTADIYRQTRAKAEDWPLTGTAYTYIDIETGEIETDWIQQNNFLHPFESAKRIWIMGEKTPAYQWPMEDLLDSDEISQYYKWRDDENADNWGKGHEEFIEEVFGDLDDRQENCVEANATEADLDWENITRELDRIYVGAEEIEIDPELIETLEKGILTQEEFDFVNEHEQVEAVENCGMSGRYPDKVWYNVRLVNGKEYSIY